LAKGLLGIDGVKSIFFGRDFITITKDTEEAWQHIKPQVFTQILDFLAEGKPIMDTNPMVSDTTILDTDSEVVATIKELLESRVRPAVQEDGGDIFYEGFDDVSGIVKVRLAGSCVGCPSSSITLRNGVENMLTHYIPEVKGIEEVGAAMEAARVAAAGGDAPHPHT
jgi:Fe-S cluster biogenesis protein NfuA